MAAKRLPSTETLNDWFKYDRESGVLYWKTRPERSAAHNKKYSGKPVGTKDKHGYIYVRIKSDGKIVRLLVHRLIWKMIYGEDAPFIDHINCIENDNRISNLRKCSQAENSRNARPQKRALPKGVHARDNGTYRAIICLDRKIIHLGTYSSAEAAHLAYCEAALKLHGQFARTK